MASQRKPAANRSRSSSARDQRTTTTQRPRSAGSKRPSGTRTSIRHLGGHVDPSKPAGNAQLDPAEQTVRTDMPRSAQKGRGKRGRGTGPSRSEDRSNQPRPHDHKDPGATGRR